MPSATFTFYDKFKERFANKEHDLFGTAGSGADTIKWALTNSAPNVATHDVLSDVTELSTSGGYTAGGQSAANVGTRSTGTVSVASSQVSWTGSAAALRPATPSLTTTRTRRRPYRLYRLRLVSGHRRERAVRRCSRFAAVHTRGLKGET
jgi:hypothetical protein